MFKTVGIPTKHIQQYVSKILLSGGGSHSLRYTML